PFSVPSIVRSASRGSGFRSSGARAPPAGTSCPQCGPSDVPPVGRHPHPQVLSVGSDPSAVHVRNTVRLTHPADACVQPEPSGTTPSDGPPPSPVLVGSS